MDLIQQILIVREYESVCTCKIRNSSAHGENDGKWWEKVLVRQYESPLFVNTQTRVFSVNISKTFMNGVY